MEGFEEFDQYHSRSVKTLFVTIQRRGNFSLNRSAYKALGEPKAVKMLFNRSKQQIGFRPTTADDIRSVPVRKQGQSDCYMLGGLTFCKEYDIDTTTARRYEVEVREGVLIIDLNAPSTDATGPRFRGDVSEDLKGKRERGLARRIGEKAFDFSGELFNDEIQVDDEIQAQDNSTLQEDEGVTATKEEAGDMLSQKEKVALENALKKGQLSNIHDILGVLGYSRNTQS